MNFSIHNAYHYKADHKGDGGESDKDYCDRIHDEYCFGVSSPQEPLAYVFARRCPSEHEREKTVVHEIGHVLGLTSGVGGAYYYIDTDVFSSNHEMSGPCIMSYASSVSNAAEFSYLCLLLGSDGLMRNSLRCGEER